MENNNRKENTGKNVESKEDVFITTLTEERLREIIRDEIRKREIEKFVPLHTDDYLENYK